MRITQALIKPMLVVVVYLVITPGAFAEIHKCKDAKGKITYSSTPCPTRATKLPVDKIINYEDSPQGRQDAAALKIQGESLREKYLNDQRQWEEIEAPKKIFIPKNANREPSQNKDPGPCLGDCISEQGLCVAQCNNDGKCIGNCGAAWGRCQSRCH